MHIFEKPMNFLKGKVDTRYSSPVVWPAKGSTLTRWYVWNVNIIFVSLGTQPNASLKFPRFQGPLSPQHPGKEGALGVFLSNN